MALEGTAGWLLGFAYAYAAARTRDRLLSDRDEAFLADQARRICALAELKPGQSKGGWRNITPYTLHVPGGNMGYHAYWVRDSVMMLESGLISSGELEDWIRFMSSVIISRDWNVQPGVATMKPAIGRAPIHGANIPRSTISFITPARFTFTGSRPAT